MTYNSVEKFTCHSSGGFPPVQFQWFIEEGNHRVNVTGESVPENGFSALMYAAKKDDNGKNITCLVKQVEGIPERVTKNLLTVLCKHSHFNGLKIQILSRNCTANLLLCVTKTCISTIFTVS